MAQSLDKQIIDAQKKLNSLLAKKEEKENNIKPLHLLTEKIHALTCDWNHTDGCAWYYDEDRENPWEMFSHKNQLQKTKEIVKKISIVTKLPENKIIEKLNEGIGEIAIIVRDRNWDELAEYLKED